MTTNGTTFPVLARVVSRSCAKRSNSPATSPLRTVCFDIFSPPPGDSDVISQVDRLSSNETKIAPRSVRIAVGAWGRSVIICMVASRVGGSATSLCQSVGRYLLPMGSLLGARCLRSELRRVILTSAARTASVLVCCFFSGARRFRFSHHFSFGIWYPASSICVGAEGRVQRAEFL